MQKDKKEPGPSRSRLGVKVAVGLLLLFMGAALILCVILYFVAEYRRGIQEKIAQKLDGLRKLEIEISLDELQKKFPPLDENRNGAVVFQNAFLQYVRDEQSYELQDSKLLEDPRSSLPDEFLGEADKMLENNRKALEMIRSVDLKSEFRYNLEYKKGMAMLLPHLSELHYGARLSRVKAIVCAHRQESDVALSSLLDIIKLSRSVREEPLFISQLVRYAIYGTFHSAMQHVLERTTLDESQLRRLMAAIQEEEDMKAMRRAFSGEVGSVNQVFDLMRKGRYEALNLLESSIEKTWKVGLGLWIYDLSGKLDEDHLYYIDSVSRNVAILDGPTHQWGEELEKLENHRKQLQSEMKHIVSMLIMPGYPSIAGKHLEYLARVRLTRIVCEIELYRFSHGNLPEGLLSFAPYLGTLPDRKSVV